ncbi:MAG: motility associated factor glycosyltransferase family protein [Solirubrobacterales bacterium]
MNTYENNLKILETRYPHIHYRLKNAKMTGVTVRDTKVPNQPTIALSDENGQYFLHSSYDPMEEADRIIKRLDVREVSSVWILGTGLGYHIMKMLNLRHRGFITVIVETDLNLFDLFLHTNVAGEALIWPYFVFMVGDIETLLTDTEALLQSKVFFSLGKLNVIMLPGFERYRGSEYKQIMDKAVQYAKYRYQSLGNSVEDTMDGVKNSFRNIKYMVESPGVQQLAGKYQGKPAIIVSAGPSLDKNVDLLREVKGKALILSNDTTFPNLIKKGIVPDMVFSIERITEVWDRFYRDTEIPDETWLVGLNVIDPRVFEAFPDRHLIAYRTTEPLSRWLDETYGSKGALNTGLSVSHLAYSTAEVLGCDPIVLIGQDLAFAGERYYASGSRSGNRGEEDMSGEVWIEDYDGNPIKTTVMLRVFRDWFVIALRSYKGLCIDATEGGARIEGTKIMTLRETIDQYIAHQSISAIQDVLDEPPVVEIGYSTREIKVFEKEFLSLIEYLEGVQDRLFDMDKDPELTWRDLAMKYQDILNEVFGQIGTNPKSSFVIQSVTTNIITRLGSYGQLIKEEDVDAFKKICKQFYENLKQSAEICMYTLREICAEIESDYSKPIQQEQ